LAALRGRSSTGDPADRKAAKLELDSLLKEHAELHGDAILLEELILENKSGTKCYIVDPMHGLELNLMKTLWKYAFGDRMTDADRELVAGYLLEIGLHYTLTSSRRASMTLNRSGFLQHSAMSLSWAPTTTRSPRARA
jgi:hypothetical protein